MERRGEGEENESSLEIVFFSSFFLLTFLLFIRKQSESRNGREGGETPLCVPEKKSLQWMEKEGGTTFAFVSFLLVFFFLFFSLLVSYKQLCFHYNI